MLYNRLLKVGFSLTFLFVIGIGNVEAKITPTEVYNGLAEIRSDLEVIRGSLDKGKNLQSDLAVKDVSPREVFAQAKTMQAKVGILYTERTGKAPDILVFVPKGKITPDHVSEIVENAKVILGQIKEAMKIKRIKSPATKLSATPTDVFVSIIQASRQLNYLINEKVKPSDVYQRIEQSILHAFVLRQQFPNASMPSQPKLDRTKKPADVYNSLIECFRIQRKVLLASGFKVLDFPSSLKANKQTKPADVYDIASLVLSEVRPAYFAIKNRKLTQGVFYPGEKSPAQVFQKSILLKKVLLDLQKYVEKDSNWLSR